MCKGGLPVKNDVEYDAALSEKIFQMLATMSFGTITLIVQDGEVIQLEKNEKIRLK